ncbi:MAG: hypothetical protein AAF533_19235 [Acidobacteriota bacterium]
MDRGRAVLGALVVSLLLPVLASASVGEGSLRVTRAGADIRLTWEGELAPGGSWTVHRGSLLSLAGGARDDSPVAAGLTELSHVDASSAGSHYWFVEDGPTVAPCNGSSALCSKRYDEVVHATTHNAMSSEEDGWILPNQTVDVPSQLESGVRALMLDIHDWFGSPHLCHGTCLGGLQPLDEGLSEIRGFLDANPREVVTLILESYSAIGDVESEFDAAGLLPLCHEQVLGEPWPTLGAMIESGRRVVILSDRDGGARPWHHDVWQHAWETSFSVERPEDFTCARNRGSSDNALFILNHFLTAPTARRSLAEQVNFDPLFTDRVLACEAESGRLPNFLTVDFHDVGDVLAVADALNSR